MTFDYHRLARSAPRYAWWKALVTGLIALAFLLIFTIVAVLVAFIVALLDPDGVGADLNRLIVEGVFDNSSPIILAFTLASVALLLPAILLARLIMGPRPLGLISSVAGRLRWGWMSRLLLPAALIYAASLAVSLFVLPSAAGEPSPIPAIGPATVALLVVTLLLVPVQATAEEYVFRGYLMQAIGGWLKHPAWAILLPVPLFMAGHLYDVWGLLDVGVFAVFAGWLTWRTGGLEAAIVAHVVNNASLFVLAAVGLVDANTSEGSPVGVLMTTVTLAVFSVWVVRAADRRGVQRWREAPEEAAASPAMTPPGIVETQP